MRTEVIVFGIPQFMRKMERVAFRVDDAAPFLTEVAADIERIEEQVFVSQGRRGGGSWKALSPETIRTKAAKNLDPRINIASGMLMRSMVDSKADHAVREITRTQLVVGTTAPGAEQSQRNRPFVRFTKYDRARWAQMWGKYIVGFRR